MLVVTEYINNGESWEDFWDDEQPIATFLSLDSLINYCKKKGFTKPKIVDRKKSDYVRYKYTFKSIEKAKELVTCEDEYEDMSWMEFRVYEIEGSKELDQFGGV